MRHSDARVEIDSVALPRHLFFQSGLPLIPQVCPIRSIVPVPPSQGCSSFPVALPPLQAAQSGKHNGNLHS